MCKNFHSGYFVAMVNSRLFCRSYFVDTPSLLYLRLPVFFIVPLRARYRHATDSIGYILLPINLNADRQEVRALPLLGHVRFRFLVYITDSVARGTAVFTALNFRLAREVEGSESRIQVSRISGSRCKNVTLLEKIHLKRNYVLTLSLAGFKTWKEKNKYN